MTSHFIHVYLDESGYLTVDWKCEAHPDADCRNYCAADECEEYCQDYDEHRPHWVSNADPRTGKSYCGVLIWIEEGGDWTEHYNGPQSDVRSGPIQLEWEGENVGYSWRYAGDPPRGKLLDMGRNYGASAIGGPGPGLADTQTARSAGGTAGPPAGVPLSDDGGVPGRDRGSSELTVPDPAPPRVCRMETGRGLHDHHYGRELDPC